MKRILFAGDFHAGHIGGLTPERWWINPDKLNKKEVKWREIQEITWNRFKQYLEELSPIHGCILGGDLPAGDDYKNKGKELITTSETKQAEICIEIVNTIPADNFVGVYGTPYHAGKQFTVEEMIAREIGFQIDSVVDINVDGIKIRARHKIGNTSTPVGGDIALRKKEISQLVWKEKHDIDIADLLVFFHVHRWRKIDDKIMSCPGLQTWTEYGGRECDGIIDWGLCAVDIENNEIIRFHKKLIRLKEVENITEVIW